MMLNVCVIIFYMTEKNDDKRQLTPDAYKPNGASRSNWFTHNRGIISKLRAIQINSYSRCVINVMMKMKFGICKFS
jgi:hypothetical protein